MNSVFNFRYLNIGRRDTGDLKEAEFSEGTMTLCESSNLGASAYEETDRLANYFRTFRTIFEAEAAVSLRTDNTR